MKALGSAPFVMPEHPNYVKHFESTIDGRWYAGNGMLEESPDSAVRCKPYRKLVPVAKRGGEIRRRRTDAHVAPSSCKRAIETSLPGNGQGGTR